MIYHVKKDIESYIDARGKARRATAGENVEIRLRSEELRLKADGFICDVDDNFQPIERPLVEEVETVEEICARRAVENAPNKAIDPKKTAKKSRAKAEG